MAATIEEYQSELVIINTQISYIYKNLHLQRLEIQTVHGKTVIQHANFADVLKTLQARKAWLEDAIAALEGTLNSIVDTSRTPRAIPLVYRG